MMRILKLSIIFITFYNVVAAHASIFDRIYHEDEPSSLEDLLKDEVSNTSKDQGHIIENNDELKWFANGVMSVLDPNIGSRAELELKLEEAVEYQDMQILLLRCARDDSGYTDNYKALVSITKKNNNRWDQNSIKIAWIFSRHHKFSFADRRYLFLLQECH